MSHNHIDTIPLPLINSGLGPFNHTTIGIINFLSCMSSCAGCDLVPKVVSTLNRLRYQAHVLFSWYSHALVLLALTSPKREA